MKKNSFSPTIPLLTVLMFCVGTRQVSAQCTENFDGVTAPALPFGWSAVTLIDCSGSNPWITSTSVPYNAPNSVFVTAPACVSDEVLISKYFSITSSAAQLTFQRKHGLELNYDGLVLEISIDGGNFVDIITAGGVFTVGGYNGTLFNGSPIGGRAAWTGSTSNAFVTTTVNLPSSANGKIVVLRWRRGTDETVSGTGVFIDNITITGCAAPACTQNFDGVTAPALPDAWVAVTALDCANSNPWVTVNSIFDSPPNSVFVNDPDCISDEYLYSRLFQIISSTAQITFRRNNDLELNYDGLVLEISIGGVPFTDILAAGCTFVSGNYTAVISNCCGNPLSGRSAWTGNSAGWVTTTINLPASANDKSIILRWRRGADNSVSGTGAYIDGLSITGSLCYVPCAATITLTPAGGSLCSSNPIVLTASGAGAVYNWYKNDIQISGVTGNTYGATSAGIYFVRSIIGGCLVTSNVAVIEPGSIAPSLGGTGVYCLGSSVSVGMPVTENSQEYTWRQNGVNVYYVPTGGGGGNQSLNFSIDASRVGNYVVETTKPGCVSVFSNSVYVRLPEITGLATVKVCYNEAIIKWNRVIPEFVSQNYQYHLSQSITPPASGTPTSDSAKTLVVNPSTTYYFHVRSSCDFSGFGNWATISFTTPAASFLTLSPSSGTICESEILLTVSGGSGVYEWYRNNNLISGNTGTTLFANSGGTYTVQSVVGGCSLISNASVITANTVVPPSLTGDGVYCTGALVDLQVVDTEVSQEYTWKLDGVPYYNIPIGGGGGNQSLVVAMSSGTEGLWLVETTKPGCPAYTSNIVFVNEANVTGLHTTLICPGQVSFAWSAVATGENYQYVVDQNSTPPANPVNPGTTSSVQAIVSSLTPSTNYYIHVRAASGPDFTSFCPSWTTISFTTPPNTLPPVTSVWTGEGNTTWTNAANWQCGLVPGTTTAVVINGGSPNYPQVTSNITIKSLTLNTGASIQVNTGIIITITGL